MQGRGEASAGAIAAIVVQCVGYVLLTIIGLVLYVTYAFWIGGLSCKHATLLTAPTGSISTCDPCLVCGDVCSRCAVEAAPTAADCAPAYGRWLQYTWDIEPKLALNDGRADVAGPISLYFGLFGLESPDKTCSAPGGCCDYVQVFDTTAKIPVLLNTFCGAARPAVVTSSGPRMRVVFESDGQTESIGFSAIYTTANFSLVDARYPMFRDIYTCVL